MNTQHNKTCIIIEDNPVFVKVLEVFLKRIGGLDIVAIHNDSMNSAVSIFRYKPDLIFLDINISGLSGLELMETLDYHPRTIVISNHSDESLASHRNVRVDAFLQKPVSFDEFSRVVEEVLDIGISA